MELEDKVEEADFEMMEIPVADSRRGTYLAKQSDISFIEMPSVVQYLRSPQTACQDGKQ